MERVAVGRFLIVQLRLPLFTGRPVMTSCHSGLKCASVHISPSVPVCTIRKLHQPPQSSKKCPCHSCLDAAFRLATNRTMQFIHDYLQLLYGSSFNDYYDCDTRILMLYLSIHHSSSLSNNSKLMYFFNKASCSASSSRAILSSHLYLTGLSFRFLN